MKLIYEAYDRAGKQKSDTIEAPSAAEASENLRKQGLYITHIRPVGAAEAQTSLKENKVKTSSKQLKNLTMLMRQLFVLVSTGTPLVESLIAIERQTKDENWKHVVERVRNRVEEGASLAEAMSEQPHSFDPITRSLVAAGESAGKLPEMLERISVLTRKQLQLRNTIIGAMVYPCLLIVVSIGVLAMLLLFVLPRFAELFKTLDMPLPPTTKFLMALSDYLILYWWTIPIVVIGLGLGIKIWVGSATGRYMLDTMVLRIPQFGKTFQNFATARLTRLLGVLLDSHLPLLDALKLTQDSMSNCHYRKLLTDAEQFVTAGEPISTAFNNPSLITPSVFEAVRSGESSGQVGPLLLNLSDFLDEENEVVVKSLTSLIEPLILIFLGVMVGFVAISLFMPLFDLTSMTSGGG